jgi:hypothetical protein
LSGHRVVCPWHQPDVATETYGAWPDAQPVTRCGARRRHRQAGRCRKPAHARHGARPGR